ncbi:adenylate/guanylate cyclase domain-containing protein [Oryzifoliimicrobium ureilyticus]|uniref:adenylate/guanylate cyclase domain-containing protein n=1 Tax=Oryzifoliimicrobium ureilyticus TaxID=3113724 RepID=UPI00307669A3
MREISPAQNWLLISAVVAVSGIIYNQLFSEQSHPIVGAIFALFISMPILAFERGIFLKRIHRRIRRLPTPTFLLAALFIYEILMSTGYALAGILLSSIGLIHPRSWVHTLVLPFNVFIYALLVCILVIFVLRVRQLLGREVFMSMLVSRYRVPLREKRVFLSIDLVGSTAFAEKFGDMRTQELLGALFATMDEPVRRYKGTIDDYIGDAVIISWPLRLGTQKARCVRCMFDILDQIERDADHWLNAFGQVPSLRAALHGGDVITAEIGVDHRKITYFGDTINIASRLETLCRTLDRPFLISTELVQQIELPADVIAEDLGAHSVKGRDQNIGVTALSRRTSTETCSATPFAASEASVRKPS